MVEPAVINGPTVIGIDLGGTSIKGAVVTGSQAGEVKTEPFRTNGTETDMITQLMDFTDQLMNESVAAICIGVPAMVDTERGIVFDMILVPGWDSVPLKQVMEERFGVPVLINNDANCFAIGEYYFGDGGNSNILVGMTIGTGLGSGIVLNGKLLTGRFCGAGEFGMMDYLDHKIEYYASGQYFTHVDGMKGEEVFRLAGAGDAKALQRYAEMGTHLGHAVKTVLYALEADTIIFGGSVRHAYPYFEKSMRKAMEDFGFRRTLDHLKISVSRLENSGILGAAALYYQSLK